MNNRKCSGEENFTCEMLKMEGNVVKKVLTWPFEQMFTRGMRERSDAALQEGR